MEVVVTTGAISRAKLQSNRHHQQTNTHNMHCRDVYKCCSCCCVVADVLQMSVKKTVVIGLSSSCRMLDRHLPVSGSAGHCGHAITKIMNFDIASCRLDVDAL